jgi:hypothetical protein
MSMKKRSFVRDAMSIFLLLFICIHGAFAQGERVTCYGNRHSERNYN